MSRLRVLVVHGDLAESERLSALLEKGGHAVLPIENLDEASEALGLQKFDAVVLPEYLAEPDLVAFARKLRESEKRHRMHTAILSCSGHVSQVEICKERSSGSYMDAYLPSHFDPSMLAPALERIADSGSETEATAQNEACEEAQIFDEEGFREQLGWDHDLIAEIVGLFLEEYLLQLQELENSLQIADLSTLSRTAHTLKGSFGTLHAERARLRTQDLELAAKGGDAQRCETLVTLLKNDLDALQPLLGELRASG